MENSSNFHARVFLRKIDLNSEPRLFMDEQNSSRLLRESLGMNNRGEGIRNQSFADGLFIDYSPRLS